MCASTVHSALGLNPTPSSVPGMWKNTLVCNDLLTKKSSAPAAMENVFLNDYNKPMIVMKS